MQIEQGEAGRDGFAEWVGTWYDGWASAHEAAYSAGVVDPVLLSRAERLASLRTPSASTRRILLAGVGEGGQVVAAGSAHLPLRDNPCLACVTVAVPPAHRRRGYASALLAALTAVAGSAGRTSLLVEIDRPVDVPEQGWPGTAFAAARGLTPRLLSVRRNLALPVDADRAERLRRDAEEHARTYRVECLTGPVAAADRDRMAGLKARMTTDAPMGDLDYEPELWDAARVREQEEEAAAMGHRWWTAVAVAPAGQWAGFTQLGWSPDDPARLHQWDTLVLREHRGRRLGTLLKLAALDRAVRDVPGARVVTTYNAASNAPMIAVNEAMGFRAVDYCEEWQAELAELRLPRPEPADRRLSELA